MQHIDSKFLYKDETILKEMTFTKIPIIILWVIAAIISIILIIVGAVDGSIITMLIVVIVLLALCGIFTATYLSRQCVVTDKRIMYVCGLLSHRYLDIPLNKIQMVMCKQTFWQRIFHYGTVVISNSVYGILGHKWLGVTNFKTIKTVVMYALNKYENTKSIYIPDQQTSDPNITVEE